MSTVEVMLEDNSSELLADVSDNLLCAAYWGNVGFGFFFFFFVKNKSFARTIWLLNSSPEAVQFAGSSFVSLATKEKVKVTD